MAVPGITEAKARELFGEPTETRQRLRRFSESARVLSSNHLRLIEQYPDQWVAVHEGHVRAHASDLETLIAEMERLQIRRDEVVIRFIERNQRALIL